MTGDLKTLECERDALYRELISLGDFRLGSLSVTYSKCGKKPCVCTQKGHPGHGPHYRWTATDKGRTIAQHLQLGPELDQVQKQVENGRHFIAWYQKALELNTKICRLRPAPEIEDERELEALKKKLRARFARK